MEGREGWMAGVVGCWSFVFFFLKNGWGMMGISVDK